MKFNKHIFVLVIILLSSCAKKPDEVRTLGSIYGVVHDESNNGTLVGATVSIPNIGNRVTSINGAYEFDELEEDVYSVTASKVGYVSVTEQVEVVSNKNKEVNFHLNLAQPAQLLVTPQSLNFGQTETSLNLSIDNAGDDELSWQVSSNQSWLTTFPTTGITTTETDEITVSVNRSLLEVENYNANLTFTSNGGNVTVPVMMEVIPVGLVLSDNLLDFGEGIIELTFMISNSGNAELNWSLTANDSWITASPTSGTITTNTETITVNVNRSGFSPNTYTGSISIDSNGGNQSISVTMVAPEGPTPEIGAQMYGGIVFYIDETGEHGLVAATEDLPSTYEWGCYGEDVEDADGEAIGTGLQNTLDIVAGCSATPIAASEALAYESEGYTDWYLPSFDELREMYNTIGNGGSQGDIGGFSNSLYWSSSEYNSYVAWTVGFPNGTTTGVPKNLTNRVRVIRAF